MSHSKKGSNQTVTGKISGRGNVNARRLAVQALARVLTNGEPLDEVIDRLCREKELGSPERSWLLEVCAGTLRWKGRLDLVLDQLCVKKKPSGDLRRALLIAAYQLIGQERTSPGAVVNETVEFIKAKDGRAPAQFANAILRKIAQQAQQWRQWEVASTLPMKEQAAWASLPEWYWEKVLTQYGFEWACDFSRATLERPELWLRFRSSQSSLGLNEGELLDFSPQIQGACRAQLKRTIDSLPGFSEGEFFVQDVSSQQLISDAIQTLREFVQFPQVRALDYCAAPGGKSIGLAWSGLQVTATDINERRLPLLRENVLRLAQENVRVASIEEVSKEAPFDFVWVDAPCSGSGIVRRHPDVRWLRKEADLLSLTAQQTQILEKVWDRLKPGGFLLYSVCSIFKEEGFQARVPSTLGGKYRLHREWLLSPHLAPGGDGFQATLIQKL